MGVEYSYGAMFGFGAEGDVPVGTREEWYEGITDQWLADQGWDALEAWTGGDQWSGKDTWAIIAKGSHRSEDRFSDDLLTRLDEPGSQVISQLARAREALRLPVEVSIGWMLFKNVF